MAVLEERHATARRRRKSSGWSFPREERRMRMRPRRARRERAKRRLRESYAGCEVWYGGGGGMERGRRTSRVTMGILPVDWNRDWAVAISAGERWFSMAGMMTASLNSNSRCVVGSNLRKATTHSPGARSHTYTHTHMYTKSALHTHHIYKGISIHPYNPLAQSQSPPAFEPRRPAPFSLATMTDA